MMRKRSGCREWEEFGVGDTEGQMMRIGLLVQRRFDSNPFVDATYIVWFTLRPQGTSKSRTVSERGSLMSEEQILARIMVFEQRQKRTYQVAGLLVILLVGALSSNRDKSGTYKTRKNSGFENWPWWMSMEPNECLSQLRFQIP